MGPRTSCTLRPPNTRSLAAAGKQLGLETILAILQIVDHTLSRLRYSTQGRTLAEMALVRIANLENLDELASLIEQVRGGMPAASARHGNRAGGGQRSHGGTLGGKKKR